VTCELVDVRWKLTAANIPLRKSFVTTNVTPFAGLAAFAALGMAAPGWTSAIACHFWNDLAGKRIQDWVRRQ